MKKTIKYGNLILSIIIMLISSALSAAEFAFDEAISITNNKKNDLYLLAEEISITANQRGSIWAGGGTIRISADTEEDLVLVGGDISVPRTVGDDLIAIGSDVEVRGHIKGDLIFAGGRLTLAREARIDGDLLATGQTIRIMGDVKGRVVIRGSDLELAGNINGDFSARARDLEISGQVKGRSILGGDRIRIRSGARFFSDIRYFTATAAPEFSNARIAPGAKIQEDPELAKSQEEAYLARKTAPLFAAVFGWQGVLASVAAASILMLIYMILFPAVFLGAGRFVATSPVSAAGTGILFMILLPTGALLLALTVIGIPASILIILLYVIVIAIGRSLTSTVLAVATLHRFQKRKTILAVVFIATIIDTILTLFVYIPIVGWAIIWLLFLIGAGAILRTIFKEREFIPVGR